LDSRFNGDTGTDYYVALDQHVSADIAIATDLRLWKDDAKLPDPRPRSDARSLCLRRRVDLFLTGLFRRDRYQLIARAQITAFLVPKYFASIRGQTVAHQEMSANRKTCASLDLSAS
jgi:hypothetical protein